MENFKSMYPREIRMIQSYVSEACDRMDYQNSPMYDEWPEQRMVDQMCNSVCEAVSTSGDMGILREAWEMQEKKTIERMSVEEEQEEEVVDQEKKGVEKGTDREKEKVETEELNDEENKKNDGKKKTVDERGEENIKEGAEENKNPMESDMEENIYQVTAEADLREHNRIIESQEMRPPLRNWWNGWGINGIRPDVQGMAWGMGSMYAPVVPVETENGPVRPPRPPQGPGPVRPPRPGIYPAWFRDIVKTLILDEMQNRRCRRGMCIG